MTDSEQIEKWLQWKVINQGRSAATAVKYRRCLLLLVQYLQKNHQCALCSCDYQKLLDFSGLHLHEIGQTARTRTGSIAAIKGFFSWAHKEKLIDIDPSIGLDYPKSGRKLPDVATLKTVEKLMMQPDLATMKGARDCAILALLSGCGLRVSGVVNLNQSSLIWTQSDNQNGLLIKVVEKGDKERLVPAPQEVWLLIRAYLGHPELKTIDRTLPDGDQVLFVSYNNKKIAPHEYYGESRRLTAKSVDQMIKTYGRRIGLPAKQLHAHALRHLFGTELQEDGHSIRDIQQLLGHADISTTQIYTSLATRRLAKTIEQSSPLKKIKTPVSTLAKSLQNP